MPSVVVRLRVYAKHIGNDWGFKAEFQLFLKSQEGKLLSGNCEVTKHEVMHRRVVSENKTYDGDGIELFDTTLTIPGTLSDVGVLNIRMEETECGRNSICFKFETKDVVEGRTETEYKCSEAAGKYITDISIV